MRKILLVEDETIARMVNTRLLTELGHAIDIAVTGEEAVTMSTKGYDIIFMDIGLPGIDGLEATRQIRAMEAESGQHSYIIALTAYPVETYRQSCLETGLDDIASKPITIDKLQTLIEQIKPIYS